MSLPAPPPPPSYKDLVSELTIKQKESRVKRPKHRIRKDAEKRGGGGQNLILRITYRMRNRAIEKKSLGKPSLGSPGAGGLHLHSALNGNVRA